MAESNENKGQPRQEPRQDQGTAQDQGGRGSDVIVEIAGELNRQLLWGPTGEMLRGRWSPQAIPPGTNIGETSKFETIPGIHIHLNPRDKTARIYDPLKLPEYEPLLKKTDHIHRQIFGGAVHPWDEQNHTLETDADVLTWLYWLRRAVDSKSAQVVSGRLPEVKEIQKMAANAKLKIRKNFSAFTTSAETILEEAKAA